MTVVPPARPTGPWCVLDSEGVVLRSCRTERAALRYVEPRPMGRPPRPPGECREHSWPGKASSIDLAALAGLAARAGVSPAEYVRTRVLG